MPELSEKELIRKTLVYLLLIRYLKDYAGFHALADGESFAEEVMKSLQKAADKFNNEPAKKAVLLLNKHSDSHLNLHIYLDSDECVEELIQPLKQFADWNEEKDEKTIIELADKFRTRISTDKTTGKTPKNEWKRAKKIIKVAGFAAAGAGVVAGLIYLFRKKNTPN